jgi:hypothetical protein
LRYNTTMNERWGLAASVLDVPLPNPAPLPPDPLPPVPDPARPDPLPPPLPPDLPRPASWRLPIVSGQP